MATLTPTPSALSTSSRALAPDLARGFMLLLIALANTPVVPVRLHHQHLLHPRHRRLDAGPRRPVRDHHRRRLPGVPDVRVPVRVRDRPDVPALPRPRSRAARGPAGAPSAASVDDRHRRRPRGPAVVRRHRRCVRAGRADLHRRLPEPEEQDAADLGQRAHRDPPSWPPSSPSSAASSPPQSPPPTGGGSASWPGSRTSTASRAGRRASSPACRSWAFLLAFQGLLTLVIPIAVLTAFWAARHRVLEEPERHRRLLTTTAVVGITLGWGGGGVHALQHLGVLPVPDHVSWVFLRHPVADRAVRRARLRRSLRTDRGRPGAAWPDRRTGHHRGHRGRQAVAVVVPGPVGDLRPAALRLGSGPRCRPRQRRRGRAGDRRLVGHRRGVLGAGASRSARPGGVAAAAARVRTFCGFLTELCGAAPSAPALPAF